MYVYLSSLLSLTITYFNIALQLDALNCYTEYISGYSVAKDTLLKICERNAGFTRFLDVRLSFFPRSAKF
jgi:hypothetical protein